MRSPARTCAGRADDEHLVANDNRRGVRVIRLARLDRDQGIHACLDTSGYASLAVFQRLAPLADLMLFDLKADHGRHRELTGLALDPILANLDWALANNVAVHLRCPLVPGLNDDELHLARIADYARRPGVVGCDVMHKCPRSDSLRTGRRLRARRWPPATIEEMHPSSLWRGLLTAPRRLHRRCPGRPPVENWRSGRTARSGAESARRHTPYSRGKPAPNSRGGRRRAAPGVRVETASRCAVCPLPFPRSRCWMKA